jgi:hypothetical protein
MAIFDNWLIERSQSNPCVIASHSKRRTGLLYDDYEWRGNRPALQ